ncbi:Phosphatidate cytidylyltransferase [Planctomycetales bacterium 10988]|nr:Phosphatidate cytidylyltransferase [Planctomycetales bacterium 10988]
MLQHRIVLGILFSVGFFLLMWLDAFPSVNGYVFACLIFVAGLTTVNELVGLLRDGKLSVSAKTIHIGTVVMLLSSPLARFLFGPPDVVFSAWFAPAIGFAASLLVVFCIEIGRYKEPAEVIARLATTVFAIGYVGWTFTFGMQLRWLGFEHQADGSCGIAALISLVLVVKLSDIGAYTVGRIAGRHKMAPRVSPGKTIEGGLGAVAAAILGAWISLVWLTPLVTSVEDWEVPWWLWVSFGVIVGLAGMIGDLAESLLKRSTGRKDSSTWMPGFGGVFDLFDSLMLAAPVVYLFWVAALSNLP